MDNKFFRCVVCIICLMISSGDESLAQTSRHSANTLGISASIGGPALLGSINASLYPQDDFSIEIGLSPIAVFAGGIYHFPRKDKPLSKWNFYSGLITQYNGETIGTNDFMLVIPLGYEYLNNGFQLAFELNVFSESLLFLPIWPGMKIGVQF